MADIWIRPRQSGTYGNGNGLSYENAVHMGTYLSNQGVWASTTEPGDTVWISGIDENGMPKAISGEVRVTSPEGNLTLNGRPPQQDFDTVFSDPAVTGSDAPNNQAMMLMGRSGFATAGTNVTAKNFVFENPRDLNSSLLGLANCHNVLIDSCVFRGRGRMGDNRAIRAYHSDFKAVSGAGGVGLVTIRNCEFTAFGDDAIFGFYEDDAITYSNPNRLFVENCYFHETTGAIAWKTANALYLDAYYDDGTLVNQFPHQVIIRNNRFTDVSNWLISVVWGYEADTGFPSGILGNVFERCGEVYTGESQNLLQLEAVRGGSVANNIFDTWYGGGWRQDGAAVIADFFQGQTAYSTIGLTIAGNTFLRGFTHPDGYTAAGKDPITETSQAKAIGLWNCQNVRMVRNKILGCELGIRNPRKRNTGCYGMRNYFKDNRIDILHQTDALDAPDPTPEMPMIANRYAGGVFAPTGAASILLNKGGTTPYPTQVWTRNQTHSSLQAGDAENYAGPWRGPASSATTR